MRFSSPESQTHSAPEDHRRASRSSTGGDIRHDAPRTSPPRRALRQSTLHPVCAPKYDRKHHPMDAFINPRNAKKRHLSGDAVEELQSSKRVKPPSKRVDSDEPDGDDDAQLSDSPASFSSTPFPKHSHQLLQDHSAKLDDVNQSLVGRRKLDTAITKSSELFDSSATLVDKDTATDSSPPRSANYRRRIVNPKTPKPFTTSTTLLNKVAVTESRLARPAKDKHREVQRVPMRVSTLAETNALKKTYEDAWLSLAEGESSQAKYQRYADRYEQAWETFGYEIQVSQLHPRQDSPKQSISSQELEKELLGSSGHTSSAISESPELSDEEHEDFKKLGESPTAPTSTAHTLDLFSTGETLDGTAETSLTVKHDPSPSLPASSGDSSTLVLRTKQEDTERPLCATWCTECIRDISDGGHLEACSDIQPSGCKKCRASNLPCHRDIPRECRRAVDVFDWLVNIFEDQYGAPAECTPDLSAVQCNLYAQALHTAIISCQRQPESENAVIGTDREQAIQDRGMRLADVVINPRLEAYLAKAASECGYPYFRSDSPL